MVGKAAGTSCGDNRHDLGPAWTDLGRKPLPFKTNVPAVFAVGDVRMFTPIPHPSLTSPSSRWSRRGLPGREPAAPAVDAARLTLPGYGSQLVAPTPPALSCEGSANVPLP